MTALHTLNKHRSKGVQPKWFPLRETITVVLDMSNNNNKLYATKPLIGEQPLAYRSVRRDEVVLSRLRLGHSYLTHSYLLKGDPPPECVTCNCRLTISHILVDCIEYDLFRLILFENNLTLTDIFNNVSPNKIISFIKRAGLYNTL